MRYFQERGDVDTMATMQLRLVLAAKFVVCLHRAGLERALIERKEDNREHTVGAIG